MRFDKKFLLYSFTIIFSILFTFILFLNYNLYIKEKHFLMDKIQKNLEICSYKLNCPNIEIDFVKKTTPFNLLTLYENKDKFFMLFENHLLKKYYLKLIISKKFFNNSLEKIKFKILKEFLIELLIILIISFIFVYILLIPLKEAYKINETFIKDILHDLNTPLATLKINLYLLKKNPDKKRIEEIEKSINVILKHQEHLKNFLSTNKNQIEVVNLKELIDEKIKFYSSLYPNIKAANKVNCKLKINKSAINSILENLISNAFKYNKKNGSIEIYLENKKLIIKDSGIGIENVEKVFDRFYKENERGIGIGMHIVKKLCDELKIPIKIVSQKDKGTTIILDLKRYC